MVAQGVYQGFIGLYQGLARLYLEFGFEIRM